MRSTQQFSITLPNEMAAAMKAKVAAGEYATESEVIRDGLRTLLARDQAVESWVRTEAAAAYDAIKADPSRGVAGGQSIDSDEPGAQRQLGGREHGAGDQRGLMLAGSALGSTTGLRGETSSGAGTTSCGNEIPSAGGRERRHFVSVP